MKAEPAHSTATTPTNARHNVRVNLSGTDDARIMCGDGQTRRFSGSTNMTFNGTQYCRLQAGGGMALITVDRSATWTCKVDGDKVTCTP